MGVAVKALQRNPLNVVPVCSDQDELLDVKLPVGGARAYNPWETDKAPKQTGSAVNAIISCTMRDIRPVRRSGARRREGADGAAAAATTMRPTTTETMMIRRRPRQGSQARWFNRRRAAS